MWLAASGFVAESTYSQVRVIRATNVSIPAGVQTDITVGIQIDSLGNESSTSFSLNFNPRTLTNPRVALGAGVPAGSNLGTNTSNVMQGQLGILVDSTSTYVVGSRSIITVTFTVPASPPGITPIMFGSVPTPQSVSSSTGALLPTTYEQGVVVIGAAAAGVDISGRVLTPDGRGIRNVVVAVTDTNGNSRITMTSSFGVYRFNDVEAGKTYTISINSKRYRFTPRVLQIVDTLADFDFVGQQ